jgi:hypothetical protein
VGHVKIIHAPRIFSIDYATRIAYKYLTEAIKPGKRGDNPMREYLICDTVTGDLEWSAGASVRQALISRENELRLTATKENDPRRAGKPLLPYNAKASHYSQGHVVDVSLADVSCVGQKQHVIREIAR